MAASSEDESNCKVVYEQADVFVHTAVAKSTFYDNIIRGKLCIIEKGLNVTVEWKPLDLTPELEYEIHSLFSGPIEYGVVTTAVKKQGSTENECTASNVDGNPYFVSFDVQEIEYIRRSDTKLSWSYVVIILKDGSTQPALHFHSGGINNLISRLQRYIWLTRSPTTKNLYIRQEKDAAMESTLNLFELFEDNRGDGLSKFLNDTYYGTLSGFSKVTHFVMKGLGGHEGMQEYRPPRDRPPDQDDQDYEILPYIDNDFLDPVTSSDRSKPLEPEEWCSFMNDDGQITNVDELKERIFRGGIHVDIKREAWKFLLGYYEFSSTYEERTQHRLTQKNLYLTMKRQWETITPVQEARFLDFAQRKHLVEKDAMRTDRTLSFYAGEDNENVKKLNDILMTYCMYNFDLGYVQGMSDLLAPILMLMEDEVDAFWCFVGFMEMEERIFEMNQQLMKQQLENLSKLVEHLYPHFWTFLVKKEAHNLFCCFRWILVSFKRDFGTGDIMTLWEVLWTQNLTPHFKLFICVAILEREKDVMMKEDYDFNDILKHINLLAGNIDLQSTLSRAEYICLKLQEKKDLPKELIPLVRFPPSQLDDTHGSDHSETMDAGFASTDDISYSDTHIDGRSSVNTDEAVVELKENSESIF